MYTSAFIVFLETKKKQKVDLAAQPPRNLLTGRIGHPPPFSCIHWVLWCICRDTPSKNLLFCFSLGFHHCHLTIAICILICSHMNILLFAGVLPLPFYHGHWYTYTLICTHYHPLNHTFAFRWGFTIAILRSPCVQILFHMHSHPPSGTPSTFH